MYKLNENLSLRKEDGKYLLFDNTGGGIYMLNELSYEIIRLCDGKNDGESIIYKIAESFDGDFEKITEDFNELIDILIDKRFIIRA